jgi:biopolymer transport protein ExbB
MGLGVAVPAVASFAIFRNRVDGLVAEAALLAEHVFADFKRMMLSARRGRKTASPQQAGSAGIQPIVPERGSR